MFVVRYGIKHAWKAIFGLVIILTRSFGGGGGSGGGSGGAGGGGSSRGTAVADKDRDPGGYTPLGENSWRAVPVLVKRGIRVEDVA